ncbi:MAG: lipopolysaccharide assembly protein LapA domain-containing protein [Candidatus Methylomirabilales bacterium]
MQVYLILGLVLATLVALFALWNSEPVTVDLLFRKIESSVAIIVLVAAGVGALLAALIGLPQAIRLRRRLRRCEAELRRPVVNDVGLSPEGRPHRDVREEEGEAWPSP